MGLKISEAQKFSIAENDKQDNPRTLEYCTSKQVSLVYTKHLS